MNKVISYDEFLTFLSERYGETQENIRNTNSFGELGLDSLSLFSLLEDIENKYDIKVDVEDLTDVDTVEKMYEYIEKSINADKKS